MRPSTYAESFPDNLATVTRQIAPALIFCSGGGLRARISWAACENSKEGCAHDGGLWQQRRAGRCCITLQAYGKRNRYSRSPEAVLEFYVGVDSKAGRGGSVRRNGHYAAAALL